MKRFIGILIAVGCVICISAQNRVERIREEMLAPNRTSVLVVAHRADWRFAPENSLAAIENSIRLGADVVELDIQKTKDGQLILMHDKTLDRTTTGKGKIAEWTLDSIRTLRLKNGAALKTKHRVPTLEEALLTAKGRVMVNLDKAYPIFDEIFPILEKTGTVGQIIMKGSKPVAEVKKDLGKYLDRIIYMPIVHLDRPGAMQQIDDFMKELHPVAFELLFESDTCQLPKQVRAKLEGKSKIWYNTLWDTMAGGHDDDKSLENPDEGYGYLIDTLGATIIQTDRTAYLLEYLQARKKRNEHKADAFH
ncbi:MULTISPECIES: glycerophosphodiester phosphodiesterase family protein [Bacteroides]|jgi:glycerophosphoryl diester phosphodiesterase|uniref:Glycerophosphodiester phosphodiesterase family protein n=2 Tax=Bacteroides TaxID=816 RepID=A0ABT5HCF4_9BACE|nr:MULTISPECIES: glycerophosphodiester phosphodiesterase family protein [Bacteroides]MBC5605055.1 glycerophosphodiester phosphodiesterase family protein [Bacteroides difficilis]MDC7138266.1 glycerophosphodiester phosphodiesterase family protein [Bacteroides zhangwenhongii]